MTFFKFLESKYASGTLELQRAFTLAKQAETKASQDLIDWQRKVFKFCSYFRLTTEFLLVKLHLKEAPKTVEELQAEQHAALVKAREDMEKLAVVSSLPDDITPA